MDRFFQTGESGFCSFCQKQSRANLHEKKRRILFNQNIIHENQIYLLQHPVFLRSQVLE